MKLFTRPAANFATSFTLALAMVLLGGCGEKRPVGGRTASGTSGTNSYGNYDADSSGGTSTYNPSSLYSNPNPTAVAQDLETLAEPESQEVLDEMMGPDNGFLDLFSNFLQSQNAQDLQNRTNMALKYLAMMMANADAKRQQEIADLMNRIAAEIQKQKKKGLDPNSIGGMFKRILTSVLGYVTATVESKLGQPAAS